MIAEDPFPQPGVTLFIGTELTQLEPQGLAGRRRASWETAKLRKEGPGPSSQGTLPSAVSPYAGTPLFPSKTSYRSLLALAAQ